MMSQAYIQEQSEQHAREARESGIEPYQPVDIFEINTWREHSVIPFEVLGDYIPLGYSVVETLFCDMSGLGDSNEPALTRGQLCDYIADHLDSDYSYAIGDIGQFQLYIKVYESNLFGLLKN